MHHVVLERWSRGTSPIHARDPRAKLLATLFLLVAIGTTPAPAVLQFVLYAALLLAAIAVARLPFRGVLVRGAAVLPFSATFAVVSWISGDRERAVLLLAKSYFSALAVLILAGVTPMPRLLYGLQKLGTPRLLVLVVQFLYRYLFVISEQAQHMRQAAQCRGGLLRGSLSARFRAAAGAVVVLFGRSYQRAEGIHRAMLSRGFDGRLVLISQLSFTSADTVFLTAALLIVSAVRLSAGLEF